MSRFGLIFSLSDDAVVRRRSSFDLESKINSSIVSCCFLSLCSLSMSEVDLEDGTGPIFVPQLQQDTSSVNTDTSLEVRELEYSESVCVPLLTSEISTE